jgi:sugar phosphate isomerase/epimerase
LASVVDAECLIIHPSGTINSHDEEHRLSCLRRSLEALVTKAEATGVRLALENMLPGHLGCMSASIREIVEAYDSPFLGVCFDTGHAHLTEEGVLEAFAALREHVVNVHLQDNDGINDQHLQPPYGTIEWEKLAGGLRAMDFLGPMAVEAPPWTGRSWSTLLREVRALVAGQLLTLDVGGRQVRVVCQTCGRYVFETSGESLCGCDG